MSPAERLNKRNEIARRLVATDYKHLAADLEKRAKEAHERESKEWGVELENIGEAEDVQLYVSVCCLSVVLTDAVLQRARFSFLCCPPSP